MIDLELTTPIFIPSARLLFDLGLHLVPVLKPGTKEVTNIVAINLSDKIIRMFNGMCLSDEEYNLVSPGSPIIGPSELSHSEESEENVW
jgi:hypothetical protein